MSGIEELLYFQEDWHTWKEKKSRAMTILHISHITTTSLLYLYTHYTLIQSFVYYTITMCKKDILSCQRIYGIYKSYLACIVSTIFIILIMIVHTYSYPELHIFFAVTTAIIIDRIVIILILRKYASIKVLTYAVFLQTLALLMLLCIIMYELINHSFWIATLVVTPVADTACILILFWNNIVIAKGALSEKICDIEEGTMHSQSISAQDHAIASKYIHENDSSGNYARQQVHKQDVHTPERPNTDSNARHPTQAIQNSSPVAYPPKKRHNNVSGKEKRKKKSRKEKHGQSLPKEVIYTENDNSNNIIVPTQRVERNAVVMQSQLQTMSQKREKNRHVRTNGMTDARVNALQSLGLAESHVRI